MNTPLTTPPVSPIHQYEVPKHSVKAPPKPKGGDSTLASINITNKKPPPAVKIIKEKEEDSLTE